MRWVLGVFLIVFLIAANSSLSQENGYDTLLICNETDQLRNIIHDSFRITIEDNCSLDANQLEVINYILGSVPRPLYNVSRIVTRNVSASYTYQYNTIVIPDLGVGESGVDHIPDEIDQYADNFSIIFVHELNRNIRRKYRYANTNFRMREYELISRAGYNRTNYIRSDYPNGYFYQNREEFFPAISDAYFQDSYLTFNLTLQRFGEGYSQPIDQFLFFADLYSLGTNRTKFYTLDENGVINWRYAYLGRDYENRINYLRFEGKEYNFGLDNMGNVLDVSGEPPQTTPDTCEDGTTIGVCSEVKPLYCYYNKTLIEKCSMCGCEEGKYCENEKCVEKCDDGTPYGGCSGMKPFYCDNGTLTENCFICGCYPYSFCEENGSCQYNQTFPNYPPSITTIGDQEVREGEPIEFLVQAYDVDQDVISYQASGLPEGAKFNSTSRRFRWVPRYDQAGSYEIIFTVSDGEFSASEKITINVTNVNRRPRAEISYPSSNQEFYVDEVIQFSGRGSRDPDGDRLVRAWSFGDGETGRGLVVNHTYQDPGTYEVKLEVSDGELSGMASIMLNIRSREEPIRDGDRDGVEDPEDRCPDTPPLITVNIYGCPLPEYTKFKNNLTTDFSKIDLSNATNVTIGVPEVGRIEFRKNTMDLTEKNLDEYVDIGRMSVEIQTEKIPELNKSAVITFYEVTIEDPLILRDGVYCHDCRVVGYSEGTFVFSVPHFTKYSLMAWASYSGYCGDNMCSLYESCYECSLDCGECKGIETPPACEEYWMCSAWSGCNELNLKTRECSDVNLCGTGRLKPEETSECREEPFPSLTFFGIIVFVLTTIYLLVDRYKKRSEVKKLGRY
ncbi:MAG: PKD domain-containing protein, partial [Candidatus Aenigmarchaeota archaeon]|nr:PKD domain-containing protein [Candidatus Aenigmarchaeota archaeon]